MLIKTDSRNYANIANAIREITGDTEQYRPEDMEPALAKFLPTSSGAISYDSFDSNGNVLSSTIYGDVLTGFAGNNKLANIVFNDEIRVVNDYACYLCSELKLTSLPNSIESIGSWSFYGCENLLLTSLPDDLKSLGFRPFYNCKNIKIESLPIGVEQLGSWTFEGCTQITKFVFHENVWDFGHGTFYECTNLTEVTFNSTPRALSLSENFFYNCKSLLTINVPWAEGVVTGAPWGATNATINYNYIN